MRICNKCEIEKELTDFGKLKSKLDGVNPWCKECMRIYSRDYDQRIKLEPEKLLKSKLIKSKSDKKYRNKNKEILNKKQREYYHSVKDIPEYKKAYKEYAEKSYINNKSQKLEYSLKYSNEKYKTDPIFKLKTLLRRRVRNYLLNKDLKKTRKSFSYLGASIEEIKKYIESKFTHEMTWENHGKVWHIDHIIPLAIGNTEEDLYKLCHYTNLQPLLIEDNLKKSSIYEGKRYCKKRNSTTNTE